MRAGPSQGATEPLARHPFLGSALCSQASLWRRDPPPPGLALGPKNHGEHGLLCFFLLKLNLQRKFLKLYPCGLVIDLYKSRLRCTPISAGAFVFFLLPSGL